MISCAESFIQKLKTISYLRLSKFLVLYDTIYFLSTMTLCHLQSAYQSYLRTVQYISQYLAADVMTNQGRGSLPKEKAVKLFKMAKNCLERSEEMYVCVQEEGRGLACRDRALVEAAPSMQQQQRCDCVEDTHH